MSLDLDKRQRAMLREMGVNVWWPETQPAAPSQAATAPQAAAAPQADAQATAVHADASPSRPGALTAQQPSPPQGSARPEGADAPGAFAAAAASAAAASAASSSAPSNPSPGDVPGASGAAPARQLPPGLVPASSLAPAPPRPRPSAQPAAAQAVPTAPAADAGTGPGAWQVGQPQLLAGEDATSEQAQRWLLLAEGRPEELADGARELLMNMLRAARLHQGVRVWLAPLERAAAGPAQVQGLDEVLARTEPDVVFVMSRLGAQALLETDQPLGRLRGQVHEFWGLPAVVSYDPGALLRTPTEKGKAWDDLCLALQVAAAQHAERLASQ